MQVYKKKSNQTGKIIVGLVVSIVIVAATFFGYQFIQKQKVEKYLQQWKTPLNDQEQAFGERTHEFKQGEKSIVSVYYPKTQETLFNDVIQETIKEIKADFKNKTLPLKKKDVYQQPVLQIDYQTVQSSQSIQTVILEIKESNFSQDQSLTRYKILAFDSKTHREYLVSSLFRKEGMYRQISKALLAELKKDKNFGQFNKVNQVILPVESIMQTLYLEKDNVKAIYAPLSLGDKQNEPVRVTIPFETLKSRLLYEYKDNDYSKIEYQERPQVNVVKEKVVALTFDDGPYTPVEKNMVDYLSSRNAKATFFVIGNRVSQYPESIQYMHEKGFEIGNHSYSHPDLTKLTPDQLDEELSKTNQAIEEITKEPVSLMRPTYGKTNASVRDQIELAMVNWTVDSLDWKLKNPQLIYNSVMRQVYPGSIILMHSIYHSTYESLKLIIPELQRQGYRIVTVSELYKIYRSDFKYHEINYSPR